MEYVTFQKDVTLPRLKIVRDDNPAEIGLGGLTILHWHRRYLLHSEAVNIRGQYGDPNDAVKDHDLAVHWPLYIYSHGGTALSLAPFSCPWDSGQVGYVGFTPKDLKDHWDLDLKEENALARAKTFAECIVANLTAWMNGDIWGYILLNDDGDQEDACWGFSDAMRGAKDRMKQYLAPEYHHLLDEAWEARE